MSETKKRAPVGAWVALAIALPVLYVLSIGPAIWLDKYAGMPALMWGLKVIYSPLVWLMDTNETMKSAMMWYIELWTD
jgi:hypothetical protein